MPEMPPVAPVPAGGSPQDGKGAAVSALTAEQTTAIAAEVAKIVQPSLSAEVTGMGKRIGASFEEKLTAALKGFAPAAPKADAPEADPASLPLKEQVSRLTAQLAERDKQTAHEANLRKSAEVRAAIEPLLVPGAAKYVVADFISRAQRGDDGNYYMKDGEATLSLLDGFKAEMAKLPDKGASILRAPGTIAPGSGAGDATTRPAPVPPQGYKSKRELRMDERTNAQGAKVWEITDKSSARLRQVQAELGSNFMPWFNALPDK